eukprot:superscaffoldBa00000734_g6876
MGKPGGKSFCLLLFLLLEKASYFPPSFFPTPPPILFSYTQTSLVSIHSCGGEDAQPGIAYTHLRQEQVEREEIARSCLAERGENQGRIGREGGRSLSLPQIQYWVCCCECVHCGEVLFTMAGSLFGRLSLEDGDSANSLEGLEIKLGGEECDEDEQRQIKTQGSM